MNLSDLPTSSATEQRVIACEIDRGTDALLTVIGHSITPADFTDPFCRRIHETVLQQHAAGLPFAAAEIWERLKPMPSAESAALVEITRTPDGDMMILPRLCVELRALACRRRIITLSAQLTHAAKNSADDMAGIIGELLATQAETAKARTWGKICDAATARAQDAIAGRINAADFLSWGWPGLDVRFQPIRKGELVIIAARPSIGKTSLARGISTAATIAGRHVLFESLETSADDVADGMATGQSGCNAAELPRMPAMDQRRFLQAIDTLRAAPFQVCEDHNLAGIIARTKATHAQTPLALLVIDYLGLMDDCKPGQGETKAQAVGTVTKALKRLALELQIVVICISQLNRQSVNEGNREPRLSDLRDSGDIEQDADRVIFIHRPDDCPITKRPQNALDDVADLPRYGCALIQAKGRNVGTGYGAIWFNRRLARFEMPVSGVHE